MLWFYAKDFEQQISETLFEFLVKFNKNKSSLEM